MSDTELLMVLGCVALSMLSGWQWLSQLLRPGARSGPDGLNRAPLWWRGLAPVIRHLVPIAARLMSARSAARTESLLRQAGLDSVLKSTDFVAGQLLAAVAGAALSWVCLSTLERIGLIPPLDSNHVLTLAGAVLLSVWYPLAWVKARRVERLRRVSRELPFYLDIVTLSVEAGANLTGALQYAVAKGPEGPFREELDRTLGDVRTGRSRGDALRALGSRLELPAVSSWVAALLAAERQGSSLGPILRAQAEQRRQERFLAAEKRAMKAPVKMLVPLLLFIFPCTFVLLLFPVAVRLLQEGLLR